MGRPCGPLYSVAVRNWLTALVEFHPQVRRDARRLPLVLTARFAVVAGGAAAVGLAIAHLG
jgi:hypothetical protein